MEEDHMKNVCRSIAVCLLVLSASAARAATFLVDTAADTHDKTPGDGNCADDPVVTGLPAAHCSLRAAIEEGNALAGDHIINFAGPFVIQLGNDLAQMRAKYVVNGAGVTVDGTYVKNSVIGYGCLDLTDSGTPAIGHGTGAAGSTIANLTVVRCNGWGIASNGHGYTYLNNHIGVDITGLLAMPNSRDGMDITASAYYPDNSTLMGIYNLLPPSLQPVDFSQINQFEIGLANALVSAAAPIHISGNLISGNEGNGIEIHGINMAAVFVSGNHIGTDITGGAAIPNLGSGVHLNASAFGNMISGNVISGNMQHGILADSGEVLLPNFVMGNRIGLGDVPDVHVGNGIAGIVVDTKPAGASPGPPNPAMTSLLIGPANVISDNEGTNNPDPDFVNSETGAGIVVSGNSDAVKILGNTIGLAEFPPGTPVASTSYGNVGDGIIVTVSGVTIGGASATTANTIAGNQRHGILIKSGSTAGTKVLGNSIGISPAFAGNLTLGNGYDGVHIDAANASFIGGANSGEGNLIAGNGRNGIALRNTGWGNLFQRNQVYANAQVHTGIGIDLEHVTNAADDPARTEYPNNYANGDQTQPIVCTGPGDSGACNGANAPGSTAGTTTVAWTLSSHPGATFRIEFFSINAADDDTATNASFLGEATVTTDGSPVPTLGAVSANTSCSGSAPGRCTTTLTADAGGAGILLTATDITNLPNLSSWFSALTCFLGLSSCPVNNSSEFSNVVVLPPPAGPIMSTVPPQTGKVGIPFSLDVSAYVNPNGSPILSYAVSAGALPNNVNLDTSSGLVSGTPTVAGAFNATIDATNANGATHAPSTSYTIAKGDQVITFGAAPALVAGGATKQVSATSSSGLTVAFTSLTLPVCTVAGTTVTPLTVGTCTIAGNQAGNANYNAAPQATQSIPVTAVAGTPPTWTGAPISVNATVGIAFNLALSTYATPNAAGDPILSYAISSGALPANLLLGTTTGLVSGTPVVAGAPSVSFTVSDKNGASSPTAITFNVAKGSQTISFGALLDRIAGSPAFVVSASASSGLAVSFSTASLGSICTVVGNQVTPVGPGQCTVHATQAGNVNWNAATPVDRSFQITAQTVTHFATQLNCFTCAAGATWTFTVTAQDGSNQTVPSYTGTVHFTSSDASAVLPSDYLFTGGDAGTHQFNVVFKTAGSQSATVTDKLTSSINGTAMTTVVAAPATHLLVTAPSTATAGTPFSVTVTALDQFSNVTTFYTGTVHFTKTDSGAGSALPTDYTFTGGDAGVHTFTNGVTLVTAGSRTVTATDTVTPSITGTTSSIFVSAASANHFTVTAPGSATVSVAFTVTVTAFDPYANVASGYAGTVHFTSSDPSLSIVLPADYTFLGGDAGTHTFTNQFTLKTTGNQTVTATDTVTSSITGTSGGITVASASSTTALSSNANPSVFGQSVTFTATVTSGSPGTPQGTVDFKEGASTLASGVALDGTAHAAFTTSSLALGGHSISAVYAGDSNFAGSTSNTVSQQVDKANVTVSIDSQNPPSPTTTMQAITVAASVTAAAPGSGTPTGSITIDDGTGDSCTITLGSATSCNLTVTSAGAKTITATYNGDANFNTGSTTAPHTVTAVTQFSGTTATGTGTATATLSGAGCSFMSAAFVPVAHTPPVGVTFPQGLFAFQVGGCGSGGSVTVTVTYPSSMPAGAQYYKYGPEPGNAAPHWYALAAGAPNNASVSSTSATFTLVDGLSGDDDVTVNGVITDQGGPGVPLSAYATNIPTLNGVGLAAFAALMLVAALVLVRRMS
jgi:hypothetical protein